MYYLLPIYLFRMARLKTTANRAISYRIFRTKVRHDSAAKLATKKSLNTSREILPPLTNSFRTRTIKKINFITTFNFQIK